ncbi:MAG: hypothetical protein KME50_13110 [Nostoc desertorum CM1-VF14]|nr:hypothetical protein [Nostoc desertorum CM1-VF14]
MVFECQSRMMRKCHVRFVGEGDGATHALLPDLKESLSHLTLEQLGFKIHPGVKTTTIVGKDKKNWY